jgi:hypothetical protein
VLVFGTVTNLLGGRLLKGLIYIALTAEVIASAGIGITLLLFHRANPWSVIFSTGAPGMVPAG